MSFLAQKANSSKLITLTYLFCNKIFGKPFNLQICFDLSFWSVIKKNSVQTKILSFLRAKILPLGIKNKY